MVMLPTARLGDTNQTWAELKSNLPIRVDILATDILQKVIHS